MQLLELLTGYTLILSQVSLVQHDDTGLQELMSPLGSRITKLQNPSSLSRQNGCILAFAKAYAQQCVHLIFALR